MVIRLRFLKSFEKSFFSNLAKVGSFQTPQIKNTVNAISIIDCIKCVFVIIITSKVNVFGDLKRSFSLPYNYIVAGSESKKTDFGSIVGKKIKKYSKKHPNSALCQNWDLFF